MRQLMVPVLALISLTVAIALIPLPAESATVASTLPTNQADDSLELLIGWKPGVSVAERDRIIAAWGGRLKRRFKIIEADSIVFGNSSARDACLAALREHPGVTHVQLVLSQDFGKAALYGGAAAMQRDHIGTMLQTITTPTVPVTVAPGDHYTHRYPAASWRHSIKIAEAQEYAQQKQEVIVALIADRDSIADPTLNKVLWVNKAERNGRPGVDDDGNGWVDDINGVRTIHEPGEPELASLNDTLQVARTTAGVADYTEDRLSNPDGRVRLMLIGAFVHRYLGHPVEEINESNDAAIIEALEYASKMGAKIAYLEGYYAAEPSPLVLAAARAFPGLIITADDRYTEHSYSGIPILMDGIIPQVMSLGGDSSNSRNGNDYYRSFVALHTPFNGLFESGWHEPMSAGLVVGVAAHLMSCYPALDRYQIKHLILSTIDRDLRSSYPYPYSAGALNAARAVLGRSAGGRLYSGNWARISREGPPHRRFFGLAYDTRRSRIYVYGGDTRLPNKGITDYGDLWYWDGKNWNKIGNSPDLIESGYTSICMYYDEKRDSIVIVGPYNINRWDGAQWHRQEVELPAGLLESYYPIYTHDPRRDRIIGIPALQKIRRVYEFDGKSWQTLDIPAPFAEAPTSLVYNPTLGMATIMTSNSNKKWTTAMWGYDGSRWQRLPMQPVVGSDGIQVYDPVGGQYYRFASSNYAQKPEYFPSDPYYIAPDIWRLTEGKWENLGYDMPVLEEGVLGYGEFRPYQGVWAADQHKFFIVGEVSTAANDEERRLSIWQYSDSITPTWIDNLIVPQGDYTGDGKADIALWHPGRGEFQIRGGKTVVQGIWGNIPAPGDYDGDGDIEYVTCHAGRNRRWWRAGTLEWVFPNRTIVFGQFDDIPVPLDYDGDGKTDIAVYRKDTAEWLFKGKNKPVNFGNPADLPVPADYDGDGRPELATYTPLTSTWHIQGLGDFQWGEPGDSPIPADYDGDGRKEIATWNPRKALWLVRDWSDGKTLIKKTFGAKWDIPVPGDYNGDGKAELATYSPITTLWSIAGRTPVKFGSPGDVPLVRGN